MKVLIAYFSRTGNTGKVAAVLHEEAAKAHEADLKKIDEVDPGGVNAYDFLIVGSPLHAGNLSDPVKTFLGAMQVDSGKKLACFITHAAPAYPDQDMEKFTGPVRKACEDHGMDYAGSFSCQGFLEEGMHEMIRARQKLSEEEWAKKVELMRPHPDAADLDKARSFARELFKG